MKTVSQAHFCCNANVMKPVLAALCYSFVTVTAMCPHVENFHSVKALASPNIFTKVASGILHCPEQICASFLTILSQLPQSSGSSLSFLTKNFIDDHPSRLCCNVTTATSVAEFSSTSVSIALCCFLFSPYFIVFRNYFSQTYTWLPLQ